MRAVSLALAMLLSTAAAAPAFADTPITADANAPKGKLPDVAAPTAYRLDLTILPESDRFSGHDEIDVTLKQAAKSLYLHGRDLDVKRAVAMVGGQAVPATFVQVDKSGTARLDFAQPLPGRQGDPGVRLYGRRSATARRACSTSRSPTNGTAGRSSKASTRAPPSPASTSPASRLRSRYR